MCNFVKIYENKDWQEVIPNGEFPKPLELKENIEYVKQFNDIENIKKIEIILCATKAGYTGSEMINYVNQNWGITESNSPDNYFNQTVRLIEEYPKYWFLRHVNGY